MPLVDAGVLAKPSLTNDHLALAVELAGAPEPDDLDDGEAATIAYASLERAAVALDDRKAIRVCRARYPAYLAYTTVDILRRGEVLDALGAVPLAEAVFDALQYGRMRVPPEHLTWVVDQVGLDRARACPSLRRTALPDPSR
jgi:hypothetical protein